MNILHMFRVFGPLDPAVADGDQSLIVSVGRRAKSASWSALSHTEPGRSFPKDGLFGGGGSGGGGYGGGGFGGGTPRGGGPHPEPQPPSATPVKISAIALVIGAGIGGLLAGLLIRSVAIFSDILVFLPEGTFRLVGGGAIVCAALGTLVWIKLGGDATVARSALVMALVFGLFAVAVGGLGSLLPLNGWLGLPLLGAATMVVAVLLRLRLSRQH